MKMLMMRLPVVLQILLLVCFSACGKGMEEVTLCFFRSEIIGF